MIRRSETSSQKPNLTNYNLLIAEYLRQGYNSLSNQVNKLVEEILKTNCKYRHDNKKSKTCGIKYKDCECCLEYTLVKYD